MELAKAICQKRAIRVIGLSVAALWLGSVAVLSVPRTIQAQNASDVSNDTGAADDSADTNNNNSDTPTDTVNASATAPTIAGSWSGTANDKIHGAGTVSMSFTQATKTVAVTIWEVTYGDSSSVGGTGSGKLKGNSLKLLLSDLTISNKCVMNVSSKVIVTSGVAGEIKGKYTLNKCFAKTSSGTIDLIPAATPSPTP